MCLGSAPDGVGFGGAPNMKGAVAAAGAGKVDAGAETGVDAGAPNMKGATAGAAAAAAGVTASVGTEVDDEGPKEKGRAVEAALVQAAAAAEDAAVGGTGEAVAEEGAVSPSGGSPAPTPGA